MSHDWDCKTGNIFLNLSCINILECIHFFICPSRFWSRKRIVKDYEFDFHLKGGREMYIDDKLYLISKGDMVFRKPGQTVYSKGDYDCYSLSLDFSGKIDIPPDRYIRQRQDECQENTHNSITDHLPSCFKPFHELDYISIFKKLTSCSYPHKIENERQCDLLMQLLLLLLSDTCRVGIHETLLRKEVSDACAFISSNYMNNIKLANIAESAHLSPNYFLRLFSNELGIPPYEYLLKTRFTKACSILAENNTSIDNIASICGFCSSSHFISSFRRRFGMTPSTYRESYQAD